MSEGKAAPVKRVVLPEIQSLGYVRRQGRGSLLELCPTGPEQLVVISSGQAAAWSIPEGRLEWEIHSPAEAGAARPGMVLLGSRTLHLWKECERVASLEGHRGRISQVALSPDSQLAVSLAEDGLRVWSLEPPTMLRELPAAGGRLQVDWESRRARVGRERWDLAAGVRLGVDDEEPNEELHGDDEGNITWEGQSWPAHEDAISLLAMEPGGSWLASAAADRVIRVWARPGELLLEFEDYQDWISCQALSPDGRFLALGTEQGAVRVVETMTGRKRHHWQEHADTVLCVGFSPKGDWLATGSEDGLIGLAQLRSGEMRLLDGHDAGPSCLAFSPDGRLLATGSSADEIVIWDVHSGLALETLLGLEAGVEQLSFSAQGLLSALYDDGSLILWETSRYSV